MVRVVQLVRISDCGPEGRGFKSHLAPGVFEESLFQGSLFLLLHKFCVTLQLSFEIEE